MNELVVTVGSPVTFLVIGSQGRRVGVDPLTKQILEEIPHGFFSPDGGPGGKEMVAILSPDPDIYTIEITGIGDGTYDLKTLYLVGGSVLLETSLTAEPIAQGEVKNQVIEVPLLVCGDVHPEGGGDKDDDILDALRKLKILVDLVIPTPLELTLGDVHPVNEVGPDGDGDIDVLDALRDLKAAVGLVEITSCGGPG